MEKTITKTQEIQREIILRLELLTTEKIHSLNGRTVTYQDVIELDIISTISNHITSLFDVTTEEVPSEILLPWAMVRVHKELLDLYTRQSKVEHDVYLDLLDKVSTHLFVGVFSSH